MDAKNRLLEFLKYLNIGQNRFEAHVGISNGYINNNKGSIGTKVLDKISAAYPELNTHWIVTGEGNMLKSDELQEQSTPTGVPHIEKIDAWCGKGQGFEVSVMKKDCPLYNIPGVEEADFTIRAKGRSMINRTHPNRSIKEGDYIACKKPHTNVIRYGEIYALATSDGVMVKVVKPCNKDGFIKLESFNTEEGYETFDYPTIDLHDMALVVAIASINRLA